MTCSSASTLKPQASVPLPNIPGLTPAGNQAFKIWAQAVLAQIQGAAGATGVNVIPQQYALLAGSALPPIASTSNCTVTADTGTPLFGAGGSYKIAITGSPATVTLAVDTAWPINPGSAWLASFFQQASAAIPAVLTITTPVKSYTTNFTTTTSGFHRLYDTLNLIADSSTSFGLSFTFTGGTGQNVWLDGLMLEPYFGVAMQPSPFISTSSPLTLDNNPDGTYVKLLGSHAAGNVAYNFKGVWSYATAYVKGDEVVYGQTYWLALAGSTNSAPSTSNANWQAVASYNAFQGAWSSVTAYVTGDEVTYSGNYWICVTGNTNSAPTTSNANWQIAGPVSIDSLSDSSSIGTLRQIVSSAATVSNAVSSSGNTLAQWGGSFIASNPWPSNVEFDVYSTGGILDIGVIINTAPDGYVFRYDGRSGFARGQILRCDSGTWTNIGTQKNGTAASSASGWHHVMFRYNGSTGDMYIYVDGILECAATDTTYVSAFCNVYGGYEISTSIVGPSTFYNGFLDSSQRVMLDTGAADGVTYIRMTAPPAVSAAATTSLSQSGTTTTINVGASTFYLGNILLSASSGSVNPGAYGKYYVYFDASTYASGAQTYQATTDATVITQNPFRFYVGTITTASGGGGIGGGGGISGGGCCLHETQLIELADGREIPAIDLEVGMTLISHEGPTPVTQLRKLPHREWYRVRLNNGVTLFVAGDHRFLDVAGNQLKTWDLKPKQMVRSRDGYAFVLGIEVLWEDATKVAIEVGEPHTYYVQGILSHNKALC